MIVNPATASSARSSAGRSRASRPITHASSSSKSSSVQPRGAQTSWSCCTTPAGIREIKDRNLIPRLDHAQPTMAPAGLHVLLERIEITNAGDWRERAVSCSKRSSPRLFAFDGLEERLEIPLAEAARPRRWMISKNSVGRSSTGLVKI